MTIVGAEGKKHYATFPNGSRLALDDREMMSAEVGNDLAKAAAVAAEFKTQFDCVYVIGGSFHL